MESLQASVAARSGVSSKLRTLVRAFSCPLGEPCERENTCAQFGLPYNETPRTPWLDGPSRPPGIAEPGRPGCRTTET